MTSNKKILLFSLLALSTLCIQKDINGERNKRLKHFINKNKKTRHNKYNQRKKNKLKDYRGRYNSRRN